jgi:ketosteroid isomerase-like protein
MTRRPPPAAVQVAMLAGSADEIETQFYEALRQADIEGLMALWADDDAIVCVQPGGPRLIGAVAIRSSFEAIFSNGGVPVQPEQVHRLQQPGCALHHLAERIAITTEQGPQSAWVLTTNFYIKTLLGWRLASHHASPGMPGAPASGSAGELPNTLH